MVNEISAVPLEANEGRALLAFFNDSKAKGLSETLLLEAMRAFVDVKYPCSDSRAAKPICIEAAYQMGASGGEPTEEERLLYESWMKGHSWLLVGDWNGSTYIHKSEVGSGMVHGGAMNTRRLWAAWRDRAALQRQSASKNQSQLQNSFKPMADKGCGTCKHGDSWGLPGCLANGVMCSPLAKGVGSHWEPLNAQQQVQQ